MFRLSDEPAAPSPSHVVVRAEAAIADGRPHDALRMVEPLLADDGPGHAPLVRAALLVQRGNARSDVDDQRGALDDLEEARRLYAAAGDRAEAGMVEMELGIALARAGRPTEALQCHERALAAYREHGDAVDVARCWQNIATCYANLGDAERERDVLHAARAVFAEHGLEESALACTYNLALTDWRTGELDAARATLTMLREAYRLRGMSRALADATDDLGAVLHEFDELEASEVLHREAAAAYEVLGLSAQRCSALVSLAHTLAHAGRLDEAEAELAVADSLASTPGSVAHVRFEQAWAAIRRGDTVRALEHCEQLEAVDRARGAESALPYRLWTEGVAWRVAGRPATAVERLRRAVTGLRALGAVLPLAEATRDLGLALAAAGQQRAAADAFRTAAEQFTTMGLHDRAADCLRH